MQLHCGKPTASFRFLCDFYAKAGKVDAGVADLTSFSAGTPGQCVLDGVYVQYVFEVLVNPAGYITLGYSKAWVMVVVV